MIFLVLLRMIARDLSISPDIEVLQVTRPVLQHRYYGNSIRECPAATKVGSAAA